METKKLSDSQANVLEKIARRSKMDDWFQIDSNNEVDRDDIVTLIEGATDSDFEALSPSDMNCLANLLINL